MISELGTASIDSEILSSIVSEWTRYLSRLF